MKTFGVMILLVGFAGFAMALDPGGPVAPEIDPGSATTALALLSGAVLMLRGRRKK